MADQDPHGQECRWTYPTPADPLRTKLKALVEEWRYRYPLETWVLMCADQLAALLAESEPERPEDLDVCPGCGVTARHLCEFWVDLDGKPHDCEDDCEAKAKLPLGHEFRENVWGDNCCCYPSSPNVLKACGQPRSAHEPKP